MPDFPPRTEQVLWDTVDNNIFAVLENDTMITYIINKNNIHGTQVTPVPELLSIEGIEFLKKFKMLFKDIRYSLF